MKSSLVILTRNEIAGVKEIVPQIPMDAVDECFVVDGGSKDGTVEFFKERGIEVHPQKSPGRGEAFRLAFERAQNEIMIFFSPDGNEDPRDIPRFLPFIEKGANIVIASRMMRGAHNEEDSDLLKPRKWANNMFNFAANLLWKKSKQPYITDSINGFRAITKTAFQKISPDAAGYCIEYQITIRAFKLGLNIVEFPTREGSRIGGESGAKSIPTGINFLKLFGSEIIVGKNFLKNKL